MLCLLLVFPRRAERCAHEYNSLCDVLWRSFGATAFFARKPFYVVWLGFGLCPQVQPFDLGLSVDDEGGVVDPRAVASQ